MSMDKLESVPIDTHMIQIAARDYGLKIPTLSLTEKSYNLIGDHFRKVFGDYAGWAHSVLFAADLKQLAVKKVISEKKVKLKVEDEKLIKSEVNLIKVEETIEIKLENHIQIPIEDVKVKMEDTIDQSLKRNSNQLPFKVVKKKKMARANILSLSLTGYAERKAGTTDVIFKSK